MQEIFSGDGPHNHFRLPFRKWIALDKGLSQNHLTQEQDFLGLRGLLKGYKPSGNAEPYLTRLSNCLTFGVPTTGYLELSKVIHKPLPFQGGLAEDNPEMKPGFQVPTSGDEEATATDHGDDAEGSNASSSTEEVPLKRAPTKAKSVVVPEIFKRAKKNPKRPLMQRRAATPSLL